MSSKLSELSKKSAVVLTAKIMYQFLSFLLVVVIARLLGAETYGEFSYITSFIVFFTIIPMLGLSNGVVSFLSRNNLTERQKQSILTYSLSIVALISSVVVIISFLFRHEIAVHLLNGKEYEVLFMIMLPSIFLIVINTIMQNALRGGRYIKEMSLMTYIGLPLIRLVFAIILVLLFDMRNVMAIVIPYYISMVATSVYYLYVLNKKKMLGPIDWKFDNRQIIQYSVPLMFTGIFATVLNNIDRYMIGYFLNSSAVGIYRVALQFGTLSSIALNAVNIVFAPIISNVYHDGKYDEMKNLYKTSTKAITIVNFMIVGMILVCSKEIMAILGDEYIVGYMAMIIIALGHAANTIVGPVGLINMMTNNQNVELRATMFTLIINIILNYLLIPVMGINGAAIATTVSLIIRNAYNFWFVYRKFNMHPYDVSYLKLTLMTGVIVIGLYYSTGFFNLYNFITLIITGIIYVLIFVVLTFYFVLSEKERKLLVRKVRDFLVKRGMRDGKQKLL